MSMLRTLYCLELYVKADVADDNEKLMTLLNERETHFDTIQRISCC